MKINVNLSAPHPQFYSADLPQSRSSLMKISYNTQKHNKDEKQKRKA
jgi:hypothetical protein